MRNFYTLLITITIGFFSFGQTTLAVIDQPNVAGVSPSASVSNTSSTGFSRGPGTLHWTPGSEYSLGSLGASNLADAIANDDYMTWTLTANASHAIEMSALDIKIARNQAKGPTRFRIYYSLDGFTTAGTPLDASNSIIPNSGGQTYSFTGLNATTTAGGTITFRFYAWGGTDNTDASYLRVFAENSWNGLGISSPGARIRGSLVIINESNIVATSFDPSDNIDHKLYDDASGLTTANAIKISEFSIQDGGDDLTDADFLGTTLTSLGFNVSNFSNLAALAIFDGNTNVAEVTSVTASTSFSGINSGAGITAGDNTSKTFSVYATFKNTVTDNQQIQLSITSATADPNGSEFTAADAGAAITPVLSDDNRIEVTASTLVFSNNTANIEINAVMFDYPVVRAQDVNANIDLDYTGNVTLTPTPATIFASSATIAVNAVLGEAIFSNLIFDEVGTNYTLVASAGTLNNSPASNPFEVYYEQTVLAVIDNPNLTQGPTVSASVPSVSSLGFTRGPGASYFSGNEFAVNGMDAANLTEALNNNDYMLFSITAEANQILQLSKLDIRLARRNNEGPKKFKIYYSVDNFNTPGIALTNASSSTTDGSSSFATSGGRSYTYDFDLNAGLEGTVNFRVYAWEGLAGSELAYYRVFPNTSWNAFGIIGPAVRITGSVTSAESNIVATTFDPTDNIDYTAYSAASGLSTANAIKIAEFSIQDGGDDLSDADLVGTTLTSLGFNVSNFSNLAALAIFDGSTNVSEVSSVTASTNFSGINSGAGITATDNAAKTFSVYATFKNTVTDNEQIQLTIDSDAAIASGSKFASSNAGAAATPVVGDDNRIEVTASTLVFSNDTSNVEVNGIMFSFPVVSAQDVNTNIDVDYTGGISLTATPSTIFAPSATIAANAVLGEATFSNLVFDEVGTNYTIVASSGTLSNSPASNPFDVTATTAAGFQIAATNTTYTINFDETIPGVNNGVYEGTGNVQVPLTGQLDSDSWAMSTVTTTNATFGANQASPSVFAKGTSNGGVNDPGFYAFQVKPNNYALGVQPDSNVFTPGNITLKSKNVTGGPVTSILIQYTVYVYNDQAASNSLDFLYSQNNAGYTSATPNIDHASIGAASSSVGWVAYEKTAIINGVSIANNGFFYMKWRGRDLTDEFTTNPRDEFAIDDIKITYNPEQVTIYTYNTDFTPSPWKPSSPDGSQNVNNIINIEKGNPSIGLNTKAGSVVVSAGASLIVNAGNTLEFAKELTLKSESNMYSSLIVNGSVTGTVNYERYVNLVGTGAVGTGGNDLISAPVLNSNQTFTDFLGLGEEDNSDVLYSVGDVYAFGPYDNVNKEYVNYDQVLNASTTLERGAGYRAARSNSAGVNVLTFSGSVETGTVSRNISTPSGGNQWNLVGNPYPSYITSTGPTNSFLAANISALDQSAVAIYGYNGGFGSESGTGTIGNFTIINNASNSEVNIAPGQGFLVANNTLTGTNTITFDYDMVTTTGTDDFILGRDATESYSLRLKASSGAKNFATEIYFNSNSGLGLDPGYDAALIGAFTSNFMIYSHLVEDNAGRNMAIQSLGSADIDEVIIPLGLKASQGQQVTIGMELSSLPADVQVYLEDNLNNSFTLLNTGDYTFTADSAIDGTGRFFLRTSNSTLSTTAVDVAGLQMYTNNDTLFVNGLLNANTAVNLYDLQGRLVLNTQLDKGTNNNQVDVSSMTTGVYIVTLNNATQQKTQKVIIK